MTSLLGFFASLTGPTLATVMSIAFIWAVATEKLVPGRRYRAERDRGDKYESGYHDATKALIESTASSVSTIEIVSSFRREIAELAAFRKDA